MSFESSYNVIVDRTLCKLVSVDLKLAHARVQNTRKCTPCIICMHIAYLAAFYRKDKSQPYII